MVDVAVVVDGVARLAVVQVGAGVKVDGVGADVFVEVLDEGGVGPSLVGGVVLGSDGSTDEGLDDAVHASGLDVLPLLELDDSGSSLAILSGSGENEVDSLGGVGDIELDGDAGIGGDFVVL